MRNGRFVFALVLFVVLVSFYKVPVTQSQNEGSSFPITVVDARGKEVTIESIEAIATGSGDVTEIIVELGFQDNLVAIDDSSVYPPDLLEQIPSIGFARRLTVEPIAAANPSVFFCSLTCSPTTVFEQLENLGIPVVIVPDIVPGNTWNGIEVPLLKVDMLSQALGVPERGAQLREKIALEIDWARTAVANVEEVPYVFLLYLRGRSLQLVSGAEVPAQFLLETIDVVDAGTDIGLVGYQTLTPQIILSAYPDYIILMERSVESFGGLDAVKEIQGVRQTPAGQNDRFIVREEQYLLGLSTRTGAILLDLASALHPSLTWEIEVNYPYDVADASGETVTVDSPDLIMATTPELVAIIQQLGFHAHLFDGENATESTLLIASPLDDIEGLRAQGITVIAVENASDVPAVAAALNVPGRGEALLARQAQETAE